MSASHHSQVHSECAVLTRTFPAMLREKRAGRDALGFVAATVPLIFLLLKKDNYHMTQGDLAYLIVSILGCLAGLAWCLAHRRSYARWRDCLQSTLRISMFATSARWRLFGGLILAQHAQRGVSPSLPPPLHPPSTHWAAILASDTAAAAELAWSSLAPFLALLNLVHPVPFPLAVPCQAFAVWQAVAHNRSVCCTLLFRNRRSSMEFVARYWREVLGTLSVLSPAPMPLAPLPSRPLCREENCCVVMSVLQLSLGFAVPLTVQAVTEARRYAKHAACAQRAAEGVQGAGVGHRVGEEKGGAGVEGEPGAQQAQRARHAQRSRVPCEAVCEWVYPRLERQLGPVWRWEVPLLLLVAAWHLATASAV